MGQEAAPIEETKDGGVPGAPVVTEEEKRSAEKEDERCDRDSDQRSTSLQIVKMTLFNLQTTLTMIKGSALASNFNFQLQNNQLIAFESIITEFEDNGDIVEPVYVIMEKLVALGTYDHPTVKQIDHSKTILRQAVRHSAVFQCMQAYNFLKQLIDSSSRFKNKPQMMEAMAKITPPGCAPFIIPDQSPANIRMRSDSEQQFPIQPAAQQDTTQPE